MKESCLYTRVFQTHLASGDSLEKLERARGAGLGCDCWHWLAQGTSVTLVGWLCFLWLLKEIITNLAAQIYYLAVLEVRSPKWVLWAKIKTSAGVFSSGSSREESISLPFPAS